MWYLISIRIHNMILPDYGCVYEYFETYNSCSTGIDVVAHRLSVSLTSQMLRCKKKLKENFQ